MSMFILCILNFGMIDIYMYVIYTHLSPVARVRLGVAFGVGYAVHRFSVGHGGGGGKDGV